jgi:hypothetical protein
VADTPPTVLDFKVHSLKPMMLKHAVILTEDLLTNETIASSTQLTTSLMPAGLDGMLSEKELIDLVAYLRSLR